MATLIGIMGEPGSGKTASLASLPPAETFYIDCDGKGLNWRGWRSSYNSENKNYKKTTEPAKVLAIVKGISEKTPNVKYVVIDTFNNLIISEEMRRCREKGYDKWTDIASYAWDIVECASELRDDLFVIILFHTQTEMNDSGYIFSRIKTNGRKTEKNNIDSKFNWLLFSKCIDGKYYFEVSANNSTARTPIDAFAETLIPNDIMTIINTAKEF